MKNRILYFVKTAALMLLLAGSAGTAGAQCPMCRMSAESNLKNGGTEGRGLNTGILYMLAMPYMLVAAVGFWWWRNRKNQEPEKEEFSDEDFARYN